MSHIVIADPHALCREALCSFIRQSQEDFNVAGVGDMSALKEHIALRTPDIVFITQDFPEFESAVAMAGEKASLIIPATESLEDDVAFAGVFPKCISCKDFVSGIRMVLSGQKFHPAILPPMPVLQDEARPRQDFTLSPREKEVLSHLVKGRSNKDIARALDLQVVTIKLHVRGICRKMKVVNRTQAAILAKECGWG